uniref:Transmembrane protein n=1 Tax=viral metagenome TaxID=1070528 RepID=A0A6C0I6H0_9ZZZZ
MCFRYINQLFKSPNIFNIFFLYFIIINIENIKMASNYGQFGKPYKGFRQEDPVDACMPDRFLDAPWNYNLGNCKQFMAQRCSENWDNKCQVYVNNIDDVTELKQFFESMANHRFCNLNDQSKCGVVCEPFNPISQTSPKVCNTMGVDAMVNASQAIDTGLYNPVKLSPVYMGGCMKKCDKIQPSEIKEDDYSINYCLQFGFCGETLGNICKIADGNGETIQNSLLQQYCNLKKNPKSPLQRSLNPEKKSLKSSQVDIEPIKTNNTYTNNIGVISVIVVVVLLCMFILNDRK